MTVGSAPYLGREDQIERLADLLAAASEGSGVFAVIRGAAGSGTTATARLIAERAPASGMGVLWGGFVDGLRGRPFGALAEVLDDRARTVDAATLAGELGDGAPALARLAPALRATLPQIPPPAPLAAPDERLRLHDAFSGWLRRATTGQPLLIVLDDVQWADADAAALIGHLVPQLARLPLLLLATWADYRGTAAAVSDRPAAPVDPEPPVALLEGAALVEIAGLDQGATRALLARVAGRPVPAAALALIQQATAGHPLTAVELYRHLHDEEMLGRAGGKEPPALEEVPRRLEEVVVWRAARLSPEGRSALGALACFADGASAQLLAPVAGLTRTHTIEALEQSVAGGLAEVGDGGRHYSISHDRIRRAVLATLSPVIRGQAYRRAAEALEAETGDEARIQAPLFADLYARSSAVPGVSVGLRHLLLAAEQARATFGFGRAARLLRVALELGPAEGTAHSDLLLRLLQAQAEAGLGEGAVATAEQISGPPGRRVVLGTNPRLPTATRAVVDPRPLIDAARVLRGHGLADGVAALERLARAAAGPRDRLTSARLDLLAEHWQATDDEAPTSVWVTGEGVGAAERNVLHDGDEADRAELFAAQRARTHDQTVALLTLSREWRRPASLLTALRGACADLSTRLGRWREAASWAGQYLAAAERYGSPRDLALALLFRARCQAVLGELAAAAGSLAAADEAMTRLGDAVDLADERLIADFTLAHYRDRDLRTLVDRVAESAAHGAQPAGLLLTAESALAHARLDDEGSARPRVEAVLAAAERWPPLTYLRDEALLVALTAAWELGWAVHTVHGMALLDAAAAAGVGGNHAATPGLARARLHALAGRLDEAHAAFAHERAALHEAGLRPLRAIADYDEGIGLAAAGEAHFGTATALLQRAVDGFAALNMIGWLARTQRLLDNGLTQATGPGGRLHFAYPLGLSRREVDLVRLVSNGAPLADAAKTLELDELTAERHLASALAKLGADDIGELPRQARRHGLGGGA